MNYRDFGNLIIRLFGIVVFMNALTDITYIISHSVLINAQNGNGFDASKFLVLLVPVASDLFLGLIFFWFSKPISNKAFFADVLNDEIKVSSIALALERVSISVLGLYFITSGFIKLSSTLVAYFRLADLIKGNILERLAEPSVGLAQWIIVAIYFAVGLFLFFRSEQVIAFRLRVSRPVLQN